MTELALKYIYTNKPKTKFFNDKEPKEYHQFLVINPEIIPDSHVCYPDSKKNCSFWISDELVKKAGIDFGDPWRETKKYKFIINSGEKKTAKFNTNNKNWMVLKTQDYWENTVKKIGFWDSENYFYEAKPKQDQPTKKQNNNPTQPENKNKTEQGKIALFCLPIVILAILLLLIIKQAKTKNN